MISIIIPIYNSERYLNDCIDSILHQTYSNIELILINDGSTDNSGVICEKYSALDRRVHVYHTRNLGVGAARNLGIEKAKGNYVFFCDSDDFLKDEDSLELLYDGAKRYEADVVKGDYATFDNTGYWSYPKLKKVHLARRELAPIDFICNVLDGEFFLWTLLIKRNVIGNLRFIEGRAYLEDMEFICQLAHRINYAVYLPIRHYVYRKHAGAISFRPNPQKISDIIEIMHCFLNNIDMKSAPEFNEFYLNKGVQLYISSVRMIAVGGFFANHRKLINNFEIDKHRQFVLSVLKTHNKPIRFILTIPPAYAIIILYLSNAFKTAIYRASYKFKSFLGIYNS